MASAMEALRKFAWASQAAYLDLLGLGRDSQPDQISTRLQQSTRAQHNRFARTQADVFAGLRGDATGLLQHHTPNDSYGFSATVFKAPAGNEYTIANTVNGVGVIFD